MLFRHALAFAVIAACFSSSAPAAAEGNGACFPACRSGYVCSPDAKCVSLCNPPCESGEVCASGQCVAKKKKSSSEAAGANAGSEERDGAPRAPLPDRPFEVGLGLGFQHAGNTDFFAPAVSFHYVLALGLEPHLLFGARAGGAFGPATVGELGLDLGYRHRFGAADAALRGGFFVTLRPELWPGAATGASGSSRTAFVGGGSVGGFVELDRFVFRVPLAGGGGKILAHSGTFGYFSASVEAAIRF